jgi:hypothetical protein
LPVEAQAMAGAPACRALMTPTELARSLNDADAPRPSSLSRMRRTPSASARRGASISGVQPMINPSVFVPSSIGRSSR